MDKRTTLLTAALFTIVILAVFHFSVGNAGLYDTTVWADIASHFLGGVVVGFGVLWALHFFWGEHLKRRSALLIVLGGVLFIGGAWEIFELIAGLPQPAAHYVLDTAMDLIADTLGALFVWGFAQKRMLI